MCRIRMGWDHVINEEIQGVKGFRFFGYYLLENEDIFRKQVDMIQNEINASGRVFYFVLSDILSCRDPFGSHGWKHLSSRAERIYNRNAFSREILSEYKYISDYGKKPVYVKCYELIL